MNCPRCGATNEDNARFCRDCGENFVEQQEGGAPVQPQADVQEPVQTGAPVQPQVPPQGAYQVPPQGAYQQPYYGQQMPPQGPKPTFSTPAAICAIIFGFLCSWWIGGILAVVALTKGNKVDSLWAMGDYQGATNAAAEGKKFLTISWIVSAVGFVFAFGYGIISGLASAL